MATLQIRKKSSKVWTHVISDGDTFILSKMYCKTDGDTFRIVEDGGSSRKEYDYSNITVYDDTDASTPETFLNSQALMLRLSALGYVGFSQDGEVVIADLISTDPSNAIGLGTDGKLFSSGGGGSTLGLIKIVDKDGDFFTNLATANAYISTFTSATITNESYSNGTYWFTVPNGTSFADAEDFLLGSTAYIVDELGLINQFGSGAFSTNSGNNLLGDVVFGYGAFEFTSGNNTLGSCTFGNQAFNVSSGINKFKNILISTDTFSFATNASGRFEIYGNIGTDETANYVNFFSGGTNTSVIWAHKSKETSNAGSIEGDLLTAQTNGAKLFFGYASGGSGSGDMTKAVYDTDDEGIVDSSKKEMVAFINKSGATITKGTIVYLKSSSSSASFPEVLKANASTEATSSKTIGAVYEDVLNDATGYVVTSGEVSNLDTSAYAIGDKLWLSTTDGLVTTTAPTQPNHAVFIGTVTRSQSTNGRILYAIQNGYELEELHNVSDTSYSTPIDTDSLLIKDDTNSLWKRLTFANLKTYLNNLYAPKSTTTKIIINDSTDSSSVIGVTTEVIAKSYTIPANSFTSTDFFKIYTSFVKDAVNGASSVRIKASNTNNFATSTTIAFLSNTNFGASTRRIGIRRQFHKFQSGNLVGFPFATTAVNDEASTTASVSTSMVLDPTQTIYLWVTIQNASTLDGTIVNAVQITN